MVASKLKYDAPRLQTLGSARDVLLSDASPALRQAVLDLQNEASRRSHR